MDSAATAPVSDDAGIHLEAHATGSPIPGARVGAAVTVGHTMVIILLLLVVLWVLGVGPLKKIRM